MYTIGKIPGVTLAVYKEGRQLNPESDGYLGKLYSGSATVLTVIDQGNDKTIGLFRDGQDHYILQKELLGMNLLRQGKFPPTKGQTFMRGLLAKRSPAPGSQAYGITMPLHVLAYESQPVNMVNYPENMLLLAQYVQDNNQPTDRVHVWKIALVSQNGQFFLTVQKAYDTTAHRDTTGKACFPRFKGHRLLEKILIEGLHPSTPLTPENKFIPPSIPTAGGLPMDEGIVEAWYDARNEGAIITRKGPARVHWSDCPPRGETCADRPRRQFLVAGERVKIGELDVPSVNPQTDRRKMRKSRFKLQASGIKIS